MMASDLSNKKIVNMGFESYMKEATLLLESAAGAV
jgi:hypothetical protein